MKEYVGCLTTVLTLGIFIVLPTYIMNAVMGEDSVATWQWVLIIIGIIIVAIYWIVVLNKESNSRNKEIYNKKTEINTLNKELKRLSEQIDKENKQIIQLNSIIHTKHPFSLVAQLYVDAHQSIFEEDRTYMIRRNNQFSTIERLAKHKEKINELEQQNKILEYRYDALVEKFFHEVKQKIQSEDELLEFIANTDTGKYILQLETMAANSQQTAIQAKREADKYIDDAKRMVDKCISECNYKIRISQYKCDEIEKLLVSKTPFSSFADLITKLNSLDYDAATHYLRYKPHPAYSTADKIEKLFKQEYIKYESLYESMKAKYDYLFSIFPDFENYLDDADEESLLQLEEFESLEDLQNQTDKVIDYISKEEWNNLSQIERYQCALDRYNNRTKSNLIIGLEYEMSVDYWLRETYKFKTYPYGALNGVHDLGRDIIAQISIDDTIYSYIVQCKLRGKKKDIDEYKEIHENVVCQVYGTSLVYQLSHPNEYVVPTICTNVELSDTAKEFAKELHILVLHTPKDWKNMTKFKYPQIKCNINQSTHERIYHLPFDQQYWRTLIIEEKGECYAHTVQEAEEKGFRRAMRHNPYTN